MVVYLDHAAGSPMPASIRGAYLAALEHVGNPSSIHSAGQAARGMLEGARERIAATLGVDAVEVVLTGGGTEAVNLGVKGLFWQRQAGAAGDRAVAPDAAPDAAPARADRPRPRILVPRAEHHATLDAVEWLAAHEGAQLRWLEVDEVGALRLDDFEAALAEGAGPVDVALLTMLAANNEVGSLQPVAEAAALAAAHGVPVHVDAIAAYGQVPLAPLPAGVSAVSLSAHKLGGPVGVGALVLRRGADVVPLLHGGSQQRGRSGTMDAAGAAAFAAASDEAHAAIAERAARKAQLRDRLAAGILAALPQVELRGAAGRAAAARAAGRVAEADAWAARALPGTLHLTVPGAEGDSLLMLLDLAGFAVSTGSACQAGVPEPSHVLLAMGLHEQAARGALRVSLGPETTEADVDALLAALPDAVARATSAGLAARTPTLGR
ncbi:cysteine desulfurase family protein [Yonghaparkia sp. Soil809]|uniref:cysteine desulfurase family protein n=1 Tax=Yonghaparkia sp. Soil809 TaxID=1736417 RepID=UPI0006FCE8EC|nr:cysteine desulfurase family protein [Yonghaparkia sp. Soil809]KRF30869.1 cysteine desulfurase [Yonghaparkia sp. Soil809]